MKSTTNLLRFACIALAVGTLAACTQDNNAGPNGPANSHYSTGQPLPHPPSAGVGPQNAGPAGSQ